MTINETTYSKKTEHGDSYWKVRTVNVVPLGPNEVHPTQPTDQHTEPSIVTTGHRDVEGDSTESGEFDQSQDNEVLDIEGDSNEVTK